ncbi:hypothetical protein FACS1894217_05970 [Clostridia bacterium]|nr:hypothetical protein FACS1894217_05970 [Clostridia bacterium]
MDTITTLLPPALRRHITNLETAEELRLRAGRRLGIVRGGTETLSGFIVTAEIIAAVMEAATQGSMHTALESVRGGYITVPGGHRLGLGGTAVMQHGEVKALRDISSINIRVARDRRGVAAPLMSRLRRPDASAYNTLILSPPGLGKTTLLRDIIRELSDGGLRVSVADERGEIAASYRGAPQLDVGTRSDVLEGCPKAVAAMLMLRAHSPQVLAVDEITAPEDVEAIRAASYCGVSLLATAHGAAMDDLWRRGAYRGAPELFERVVTIKMVGGKRTYGVDAL